MMADKSRRITLGRLENADADSSRRSDSSPRADFVTASMMVLHAILDNQDTSPGYDALKPGLTAEKMQSRHDVQLPRRGSPMFLRDVVDKVHIAPGRTL
jgi:hypothetical protein